MSAAHIYSLSPAPQLSAPDVVLELTREQAAAIATALLAQSVLLFNASSQQEAAGRYEAASGLFHEGYVLSKLDCTIREAVRNANR